MDDNNKRAVGVISSALHVKCRALVVTPIIQLNLKYSQRLTKNLRQMLLFLSSFVPISGPRRSSRN
jgi:hypothetical protein